MQRLTEHGYPFPPERVPIYGLVVRNMYCESFTYLEGFSRDEVWEKYEAGHAAMKYGTVYDGYTRRGFRREDLEAYRAECRRIDETTCELPPVADLLLRWEAKKLPPSRFAEIDPAKAGLKETRDLLHEIRSAKRNEHLRDSWKDTP